MTCDGITLKLLKEIEEARQLMVLCGEKYGLTHPKTIKLSHVLDELLNDFYNAGFSKPVQSKGSFTLH